MGDHRAMAALFTEDCTTDYGPVTGGERHGRAAVEAWLTGIHRFARTSHHLSNVQVAFDGPDRATGVCYVLAWHRFPATAGVPDGWLFARYLDVYRRTSEGWRIHERREVMHGDVDMARAWTYLDRLGPDGTPATG
jgi:hypothetical protein